MYWPIYDNSPNDLDDVTPSKLEPHKGSNFVFDEVNSEVEKVNPTGC